MTSSLLSRSRPLALLLVLGCGSAETPSAPPPTVTAPPPTVQAPPKPAAPRTSPSSAPEQKPAPAKPAVLPPGAVLVGGDAPNAGVIPREQRPELLALVVNPPAGQNSSFLSIASQPVQPPAATVTLPVGFLAVAEAGFDSAGLPLRIRCEKDSSLMALVPGGLAIQGAENAGAASPRHPIDVDAFYIDVYEITVEKFQKFREANRGEKSTPPAPANASFPLQPAVGLNWRDAMLYCKWAGRELPTESEWEKAARGPKGFVYPWGDGRPLWDRSRAPGQIDDVGTFRTDESPFGVMDLAGNAREWCQDFFTEDAYRQAPTPGSAAARNWAGPKTDKGSRRVVKGNPDGWETWARQGVSMTERTPGVGFRSVLRLAGVAAAPRTQTPGPAAATPPPAERTPAAPKSAF